MLTRRPASERGHADHGWLKTYHTFSFANYYDPRHMGFRALRVINDDIVEADQGFGTHGHKDMEIVTYVLDGALEHKDSMGTGSVLAPGDVQRMSAGRGVTHSEFNHSSSERLRLLQIWILPEEQGIEPGYQEKHFPRDDKLNRLCLVASPDEAEGSLKIHQDARIYAAILEDGKTLEHTLEPGRHAWLQVARGRLKVGDQELIEGDGLAVSEETKLVLEGVDSAEFLLFDLD
jgi:redox-sensitive bicupin YhaK (pirin superfamily)